ncbi:hypothetical protein [Metabacillus litoralis]|nr:hypothetical protein [Metabacillus litoralis]MCM3412665.1 hypothetical protein [Metabacillus litoralis]
MKKLVEEGMVEVPPSSFLSCGVRRAFPHGIKWINRYIFVLKIKELEH